MKHLRFRGSGGGHSMTNLFANRRPRRAPMGLAATELRGHADHHGFHQDTPDVLHQPQRCYGRTRRTQAGYLAT